MRTIRNIKFLLTVLFAGFLPVCRLLSCGAGMERLTGKNIVLGVTGGIAAYKAAELCRLLGKEGADVHVVMTEAAEAFIGALTLQTLSASGFLTGDEPYEHVRGWIAERLVRSQRVHEEFHALCVRAGYPPA